jgi:hypothetical protein
MIVSNIYTKMKKAVHISNSLFRKLNCLKCRMGKIYAKVNQYIWVWPSIGIHPR